MPSRSAEEARAEHVVRASARDRLEDALEVGGVVLAVAVEVHGGGVALVAGDLEAGAQGGAEAARALDASGRARRARARSRAWRRASRRPRAARPRGSPQAALGMPASTLPTAGSSSRATTMARQRAPAGRCAGSTQRVLAPAPAAGRAPPRAAARRAGGRSSPPARAPSAARARSRPGGAPSPQTTNGTGRSPQSRWPWPPIPRPWPWSAMRITVASSSLPRSSRKPRKLADVAVGLRELVEVLGAAHAAHVAELVGGEQLEHQQVGILLLHHPSALGHERVGRSARSAAPRSPSAPPPRRTGRAGARSPRVGRGGRGARARRRRTRAARRAAERSSSACRARPASRR